MSNYIEEDRIREYLIEHEALRVSVGYLEERMETIDSILRNYHNFVIGEDRLINVRG